MDNKECKEFVMRALNNHRGDDLYRARAAFKNCTMADMDKEYGQSGKTRMQILKEYEAFEEKWLEAQKWLESKQ